MTQPAATVSDDKWTTRCRVENKQFKFKIDTGDRCNTLNLSDYQKIQQEGELKRPTKLLCTYSNHQSKSVAVTELSLEHNSNLATTTFQIADIDEENALSRNTAETLQLLSRLVSDDTPPTPRRRGRSRSRRNSRVPIPYSSNRYIAWNLHTQIGI